MIVGLVPALASKLKVIRFVVLEQPACISSRAVRSDRPLTTAFKKHLSSETLS